MTLRAIGDGDFVGATSPVLIFTAEEIADIADVLDGAAEVIAGLGDDLPDDAALLHGFPRWMLVAAYAARLRGLRESLTARAGTPAPTCQN